MLHERQQLWRAHIHKACFLCLMVAGKKKKETRLAIRALLIPPTLTPLLHPPTTTHTPRGTCKQSNTRCCWLVQLGEGAEFLKLAGDFTSQRAQSSCQSALPGFIIGERVKTFPFEGVYGAASNNRYQKPPAWNCPLATGRVSPVRGDQRETPPYEASVSSGSFLY